MKEHIAVTVIGEDRSGKSTLINAYICKEFPLEVPGMLEVAKMPPESSSNISITVMDSKGSESHDELNHKISSADCIIALHDLTRPQTLHMLHTLWLPRILRLGEKPVILVGSKADLQTAADTEIDTNASLNVEDVMKQFQFVAHAVKSSARDQISVEQVFKTVELAVNYPLGPIFDLQTAQFTPSCVRALKRIFRVLDRDCDGTLSDRELNDLQRACFGVTLNREEIQGMKKLIHCRQDDGISLVGFQRLMYLFVDKDLTPSLWTVLRHFGYDDCLELDLDIDLLQTAAGPEEDSNSNSDRSRPARPHPHRPVTTLSPRALRFLRCLPRAVSKDELAKPRSSSSSSWSGSVPRDDAIVSRRALQEVFSVLAPDSEHPWRPWMHTPDAAPQSTDLEVGDMCFLFSDPDPASPGLTIGRWLAHWRLLAAMRPALVQRLLYCLGFVEAESGVQLREPISHLDPQVLPLVDTVVVLVLAGGRCDGGRVVAALGGGSLGSHRSRCVGASTGSTGGWWGGSDRLLVWVEGSAADLEPSAAAATAGEGVGVDESPRSVGFDLVLLLADPGDAGSVREALRLEHTLPDDVPRLFALTQSQVGDAAAVHATRGESAGSDDAAAALEDLSRHVAESALPRLTRVCVADGGGVGVGAARGVLDLCVLVGHIAQTPTRALRRRGRGGKTQYSTYLVYVGFGISVLVVVGVVFVVTRFPKQLGLNAAFHAIVPPLGQS